MYTYIKYKIINKSTYPNVILGYQVLDTRSSINYPSNIYYSTFNILYWIKKNINIIYIYNIIAYISDKV